MFPNSPTWKYLCDSVYWERYAIATYFKVLMQQCVQTTVHRRLNRQDNLPFWNDGRGYLFNINMQYWPFVLVAYTQQPGSSFLFKVHQEESERLYFHKILSQHVVCFWVFFSIYLVLHLFQSCVTCRGSYGGSGVCTFTCQSSIPGADMTEITANLISVLCNPFPC